MLRIKEERLQKLTDAAIEQGRLPPRISAHNIVVEQLSEEEQLTLIEAQEEAENGGKTTYFLKSVGIVVAEILLNTIIRILNSTSRTPGMSIGLNFQLSSGMKAALFQQKLERGGDVEELKTRMAEKKKRSNFCADLCASFFLVFFTLICPCMKGTFINSAVKVHGKRRMKTASMSRAMADAVRVGC